MNVSANETARCGASAPVPEKKPSVGFKIVDCILIAGILLPLLGGIVIRVLTHPVESGISITGAVILAEFDFPLQKLQLTESQVNSWLVMASISALCLFLAHGLNSGIRCRRHLIAEWIVEKTDSLVHENMGDFFRAFSPFVAAIMALSLFSSLQSLLGLFPPTSDFNVVFGWSLLVFIIITHYKLKGGLGYYLKGFTEPFLPFTPLNILGELRHLFQWRFVTTVMYSPARSSLRLLQQGLRQSRQRYSGNSPACSEAFRSFRSVFPPC